jgi:hypothetical protein
VPDRFEVPVEKAMGWPRGVIQKFQRSIELPNQSWPTTFIVELGDRADAEGICDEEKCQNAHQSPPQRSSGARIVRVLARILVVAHALTVMLTVCGSKGACELVEARRGDHSSAVKWSRTPVETRSTASEHDFFTTENAESAEIYFGAALGADDFFVLCEWGNDCAFR